MTEHKNIAAALIAAQQAFGEVTKGKTVKVETQKGKYSYSYADLGTVLDAVMPALHENGLALTQCMDLKDGTPCIKTMLMHANNVDYIESWTPIYWADKADTQKYGGAITYCRRYALMAMLSLSAEDDDGQQARQPAPKRDVVAPDNVDMQTGEIDDKNQMNLKIGLIRRINARGELIGKTEDEMKESMRLVYAKETPAEEFSRKSLSVDQLHEFLDLADRTLAKRKAEAARA